jgi:hypothetical protein
MLKNEKDFTVIIYVKKPHNFTPRNKKVFLMRVFFHKLDNQVLKVLERVDCFFLPHISYKNFIYNYNNKKILRSTSSNFNLEWRLRYAIGVMESNKKFLCYRLRFYIYSTTALRVLRFRY